MEGKFWEIRTHQDISVITHTLVIAVAHGNFTGHLGFQYNWETVQFDQHIFKTLKQYQNVFFGASCGFFICNDRYLLSQWTMKENMLLFIFAALSRIYFHLFLVYKEAWRSCPRVSYSFDRSRSNNYMYIHSQPQKWKYTIFNNVNIIYILSGKSPILKYFVN